MGDLAKCGLDFRPWLKDRSVFVTGHTGFKGSWLTMWLAAIGARVTGYALEPPTQPSNFVASHIEPMLERHILGDVRDRARLCQAVQQAVPDVILHLAAQPLVRASYANPAETFETNLLGTVNLLEAVRQLDQPCAVVVVTSDKCYANDNQGWDFRECDPMGGHDPYSASKGACELIVASYRESYFPPTKLAQHGVQLATARAGNVIGGGDWASDRIVVDMQRALAAGESISVRSPSAIRPWQHVLEPLSGYCQLAAQMLAAGGPQWASGWNFGPYLGEERTVAELVDTFIATWGSGTWHDASQGNAPSEAQTLRLSIEKAMTRMHWSPVWSVEEAVRRTANWYRNYHEDPHRDMAPYCWSDIQAYEEVLYAQEATLPFRVQDAASPDGYQTQVA